MTEPSEKAWEGLQRLGYSLLTGADGGGAYYSPRHMVEDWRGLRCRHSDVARAACFEHLRKTPAMMEALVEDLGAVRVELPEEMEGWVAFHSDIRCPPGRGGSPYAALVSLWLKVQEGQNE